jgi:hypothetical protein
LSVTVVTRLSAAEAQARKVRVKHRA